MAILRAAINQGSIEMHIDEGHTVYFYDRYGSREIFDGVALYAGFNNEGTYSITIKFSYSGKHLDSTQDADCCYPALDDLVDREIEEAAQAIRSAEHFFIKSLDKTT